MTENEISRIIVTAAIEVHRTLGGPGLMEDLYEEALCLELADAGLTVQRQVKVPVYYKRRRLRKHLRIDLLVDGKVIVECKAVPKYTAIFEAQALTYLRVRDLRLAMVVNFGERQVKTGIHRVVNRLPDEAFVSRS